MITVEEQKIANLRSEALAVCDRCERPVDDIARVTVIASIERDLTVLEQEKERLEDAAIKSQRLADEIPPPGEQTTPSAEVHALLSAARQAAETLVRLEERYEAAGALLASVEQDSLSEAHTAARAKLDAAEQAFHAAVEVAEPDRESVLSFESAAKLKRDQLTMLAASRGAAQE